MRLHEANVLEFETLPSFWMDYDLIVSAAMLEYVPRFELLGALKALRTRLARHGWIVVFITRKNWLTKLLIERWWQVNRYTREEFREAFIAVGFRDISFKRFPPFYFSQNWGGHIIEAKSSTAD